MFKICILCVFILSCNAGGSGGGYGGSSGGGGILGGGYGGGPVSAAVRSQHTVEYRHVNIPQEIIQPQVIEVDGAPLPLTIHFKSASSNINVQQSHTPSQPGDVQQTSSEDEPHKLVHEVTKPIIQEVREIITPFRRVIQEIRPVQEEIQTIVAKGEARGGGLGGGFGGGFGGGIEGLGGGGFSNGAGLGGYSGGVSGGGHGGGSVISIVDGGGHSSYGGSSASYRSRAR